MGKPQIWTIKQIWTTTLKNVENSAVEMPKDSEFVEYKA